MPRRKMLINADQPEVCRVVIVEDGKIEEYITEHATQELIKGNVYHGVITRVEPAIEAAFVDYGGKKYGFLPFKDVRSESYRHTGEKKAKLRIQDVLFKGQKLLVQVVKEERDAKGPTLTNYITIPGRFLVIMNGSDSTGVSRKIEDETERKNLKKILADLAPPENIGVIIRTAGLGRSKAELHNDMQMLLKVLENITALSMTTEPPALLYRGPDMVVRTVRDHYTDDIEEILVDNINACNAIKEFFDLVMPTAQPRITLYSDTKPLFSMHNIEEQIESIYSRRAPLPSGGSMVFDIGEALVAIDVNSGKTTSASELEETALRTNLEAAQEIGRQLRLRDLGGLIVIDFIDMMQKKNKTQIEKELKLAFKKDKARINISRISKFGLIEMSRQRMSAPTKEGVFERCRFCGGTGQLKSRAAISLNVIRKIQGYLATGKIKTLAVEVSNEIADYFLNNKMKYFMDLQEKHNVKIQFSCKEGLAYENFGYTILEKKEDKSFEAKPRHEYREREVVPEPKPSQQADVAEVAPSTESAESAPPAFGAPAIEMIFTPIIATTQATESQAAQPAMPAQEGTGRPGGPPHRRPGRRMGRRGGGGPQSKDDPRKRRGLPGRRGMRGRGRRWRPHNPNFPQPEAGSTGGETSHFPRLDQGIDQPASFDSISPVQENHSATSAPDHQPAPGREEPNV